MPILKKGNQKKIEKIARSKLETVFFGTISSGNRQKTQSKILRKYREYSEKKYNSEAIKNLGKSFKKKLKVENEWRVQPL
jgi:hypothetical protein